MGYGGVWVPKLMIALKVIPVCFPPGGVDVDWIISETKKPRSWTDRNP